MSEIARMSKFVAYGTWLDAIGPFVNACQGMAFTPAALYFVQKISLVALKVLVD